MADEKYLDRKVKDNFYTVNDFLMFRNIHKLPNLFFKSLDELIDKDIQRTKDGFPRKIRFKKLSSRDGSKVVIVPTTVEEKFIHDNRLFRLTREGREGSPTGGTGEGEEGDVLGEEPIEQQGQGEGDGREGGQGEGEDHGLGSDAYDIGRLLTEKFKLPNIDDKKKKKFLKKYTYEFTDLNKRSGQLLDKKRTLKSIIKTNHALGRIDDVDNIDTSKLIVAPDDMIYRILSEEKDFESQAVVFFLRDYSGSMMGKPTEVILYQHLLIYSWLMFQYKKQVIPRFIVHDNDAKEVPDLDTYRRSSVQGGTTVASAFELVDKLVEEESLAVDYNIYIFYGTDGDDWGQGASEAVPAIKKTLEYSNRVGITVARNSWSGTDTTPVEDYLKKAGLLGKKYRKKFRLFAINAKDANDDKIIEGIRKLVS